MKIIQVLPEMNAGGVESYIFDLASGLASIGVESVVVSNGGRMVKDLERAGCRHIYMPVHKKSLGSLLRVKAMKRLMISERPDIVHYHSRVPGWISLLAWKSIAPANRPRLASTFHGFHSVGLYSSIMNRSERVIAVSESIKNHILTDYPAVNHDIIRVIYEGVNPERYHPDYTPPDDWLTQWRTRFPDDSTLRILLPGRMTRLKGHEDFVNLIAQLKKQSLNVNGLIAGDTHPKKIAYRSKIENLVSDLGIINEVVFLGHRNDLREVMTQCDLVLSLTRQPEAFGRVVLEALALGKPVIGYDCGGVGELLGKMFPYGKVPPGDQRKLEDAVVRIMTHKMRPTGIEDGYTIKAMVRATMGVYEELVLS